MLDAEIDKKDALDPISHMYASVPTWLRKRMPVPLNRDVCRTPMQWDSTANAGFTTVDAKPWLPISGELEQRNVAGQSVDRSSLFSSYKALLQLRKLHPVFSQGALKVVQESVSGRNVLMYIKTLGEQELTVVANFGNKEIQLPESTRNLPMVFTMGWNGSEGIGPNGCILFLRD